MKGYVYILSNPSYGESLKIGMTTICPERRAKDLSATGVLHPFKVEHSVKVDDCAAFEKHVHSVLNGCRVSKSKEFFDIPVAQAVDLVDKEAQRISDIKKYDEEGERMRRTFKVGVFLVRLLRGDDAKDGCLWYGILAGKNATELFWAIDEFTDPYQCEYRAIKPHDLSIFWKANSDGTSPDNEGVSRIDLGDSIGDYLHIYEDDNKTKKDSGWKRWKTQPAMPRWD